MKKINNRKHMTTAATVLTAVLTVILYAFHPADIYAARFIEPTEQAAGSDMTYMHCVYYPYFVFDSAQSGSVSELRRTVDLKYAESVWIDPPKAKGCSYCKDACDRYTGYKVKLKIEKSDGKVFTSYGTELTGLGDEDFGAEDVCVEITHNPGDRCMFCGRYAGDVINVDSFHVKKRYITFLEHPRSVELSSGPNISFSVRAKYDGPYKWVRKENRTWVELRDGYGQFNEIYSGTNTDHLNIANVSEAMAGQEYACRLTGAFNNGAYSQSAFILKPEVPVTPTPTPSPTPTSTPTPTPTPIVTQPPGPNPTQPPATPTPTPIKPGAGGSSDYKPQTSSSSHTGGGGSGTGSGSLSGKTSSSTSSSSKGDTGYTGSIPSGGSSSKDPVLQPENGSSTGRGKSGSTAAGASSRGKSSSERESETSGTSRTSSKTAGRRTVTKNGVLYIIDDENDAVTPAGSEIGMQDNTPEETEEEMEYSASDLAIEGEVRDRDLNKGFWESGQGVALIIAAVCLLFVLALFFLFFGVIVFGEVEEHDEVFELCAIRLMKRRDGNWHVNLGSAFDDNAVLKLRIGILFAIVFEGWDITGRVVGVHEGEVTASVEQNMLVYRRNIRRSV